jgi:alpha-L-rhamnosidase
MPRRTIVGILLLAAVLLATRGVAEDGLSMNRVSLTDSTHVEDLRCEYLIEPMGVDTLNPRLSWIIVSDRRGEKQTAYQVLVASSQGLLAENRADLWNSGKVASDESAHVPYAGKPLKSKQRCYWKVRVWDREGSPSAWSKSSSWMTGFLQPEDWQAKWITMDDAEGIAHPWFRRTFDLESEVVHAEIYINTPSHYELYINGQKASPDVLVPAHANLKKRFLYNVYDVSRLLQKGTNCVALWMGPGWYQPRYENPGNAPIVRLVLDVYSKNGLFQLITDDQWRVADSCISQIGPWGWNAMGGERWDAGKYVEDWNRVTLDDSRWASAVEIPAPAGKSHNKIDLSAIRSREPTKPIETSWQAMPGSRTGSPIAPKKIYAHNGKWVIDFGTTLTGWMRLRMSDLKPGQEITIDYSDLNEPPFAHIANQDGFQTFNQKDAFVAGDDPTGVFCSKFNQHAFRYAVIDGLSKAPALQDAEAMSVYSDLETAGTFRCSNELFNRIHQITVRTYYSQIPCGALGGGEAREKLGYGDGGSFLSGMLCNLRSDSFFQKWLRDWCDGQQPDGFLGHTAPEYYPAGGGPSWGGEASELVRRLYLYYGDCRAISSAYPTLKKYIDHLESHTERDILKYFNPYRPGYQEWYFLGDWTPPGASADQHGFVMGSKAHREFFNNCYRVMLWEQLAGFAEALGDQGEAQRCRDRLAVLRPLIHKTFYDVDKKTYQVNGQCELIIALYSRIVPEELRPEILKQLEDNILVKNNGHLNTGLQGTFLLLDLLIRENRNDLVAVVMNQTTFPGWGFLIKERNVTTWPETWSGWGSQIIQVVGTPGAWFYEGLAGILPDPKQPGFKHFKIRPGVVDSVDWVECSYVAPYGKIVSNWRCEGGTLEMDVTVPANASATIYVPADAAAGVTESGAEAAQAEGVEFLQMQDGYARFKVGAGAYRFKSRRSTGDHDDDRRELHL